MRKMAKTFALASILALAFSIPVRAQTGSDAQGNANTSASNPAPAGQAPDEVMKKLSDLVHAGKYAEAQQLAAGLLLAYPDDQRLAKAKALLDAPKATLVFVSQFIRKCKSKSVTKPPPLPASAKL